MKDIEINKMEEAPRGGRVATIDTENDRRAVILAGGDGTRLRSLAPERVLSTLASIGARVEWLQQGV